jgi:mycofactocin system transcriptional regulator
MALVVTMEGVVAANFLSMSEVFTTGATRGARGRPTATSHAEIERVAFELFAERGFAATTLDDIAREVGVGRRTLFRYYSSKNDIPWGQFGRTLEQFERTLEEMPAELPVHEAVHKAVVEFNRFPHDAQPSHRDRMRLILTTPDLQAHSVHQYAAWRAVIAEFVAQRMDRRPLDLLPQLAGHVSLALALAAYEAWLADDEADLLALLERGLVELKSYLDDRATVRSARGR